MPLRTRSSVQSPAAYSFAQLAGNQLAARLALTPSAAQRNNLVTAIQDSGYRFKISPDETAGGLVEAQLTFGFDPGDVRRYGFIGGVGQNNTAAFGLTLQGLNGKPGVIKFAAGDWVADYVINANCVILEGVGGCGELNISCLRPHTTCSYGTVLATALVIGTLYQIISIGTSDYTTSGASTNTVGVWFRCTAAGTGGTGTVRSAGTSTVTFGNGSQIFRKCGVSNINISGDDGSLAYTSSAGNFGNQADATLTVSGQSSFFAHRIELMAGIQTLRLEPRGGFPVTSTHFNEWQFRNDNQINVITNITLAASAVITCNTTSAVNPYAVNQILAFDSVVGTTQMNGLSGTVTAIGGSTGAWTATLNINSSAFTAYASGGKSYLASARAALIRRNDLVTAGNYLTNVQFTNGHINGPPGSTVISGNGAYAIEVDSSGSNGLTIGIGFSYLDLKGCTAPAGLNTCGGVFYRTGSENIQYYAVNLDPGNTGLNVIDTLSATQDPASLYTGLVVADGQYMKNASGNILIPSGSQSALRQPLIRDPYIELVNGIIFTNSLDPYGNKPADGAAPLPMLIADGALGPMNWLNTELKVGTIGKGLTLKEGANARQGVATFAAGTVTVATTAVLAAASQSIIVSRQDGGANPGAAFVNGRTPGTSFVINSTNPADTGPVFWELRGRA